RLPSLHVLSSLGVKTQPVAGPTQASSVQELPSSQTKGACSHPVTGLHASVVQTLSSSQLLGAPVQTPLLQVSFWVQALPSLHAAPVLGVWRHPCCASQTSFVQGLPSLQPCTVQQPSGLQTPLQLVVVQQALTVTSSTASPESC